MKIIRLLALTLLVMASFVFRSQAQVQVAGTLRVDVNATNASLGYLFEITNNGSIGGIFQASWPPNGVFSNTVSTNIAFNTGQQSVNNNTNATYLSPYNEQPMVINAGNGTKAIAFSSRSYLANVITNGANVGTAADATNTPNNNAPNPAQYTNFSLANGTNFLNYNTNAIIASGLTAANPTCSIEAWVLAPALGGEGTIIAWGSRNANSNLSFNLGVNGQGAVNRNGQDMNWGAAPPTNNVWHHLVYTFDGSVTKVYSDGILKNSMTNNATFQPNPNGTIRIAAQGALGTAAGVANAAVLAVGAGTGGTGNTRSEMILARVRVHSGVLTPAQIVNNYTFELPDFFITPTPLVAGPTHRYSFTNAAGDAVGQTVLDTGSAGGADATVKSTLSQSAQFTGTRLHINGLIGAANTGTSAVIAQGPAYVDLPNGMISSLSASNAGPGAVTVEGWAWITSSSTWGRYFSFGGTSATNNPGGEQPNATATVLGYGGQRYFELEQLGGSRDSVRFEIDSALTNPNGTNFNNSPNARITQDILFNGVNSPYQATHYAVTWNEATFETIVYLNGIQVDRQTQVAKMNQIQDVNCWLGRSPFQGDSHLKGDYQEFRIYNRVLTPGEVMMNELAGPTQLVTSALGAPTALHITPNVASLWTGTYRSVRVTADYASNSGINVTSGMGTVYSSSNTNIAQVSQEGTINVVGTGSVVITAQLGAQSASYTNTAAAVPLTMLHQYKFNGDATDFVGGPTFDGAGVNTAFSGTKVLMDPTFTSYVQLPAQIVTGLEAVTIELWGDFRASANNVQLFAFGDQNPLTGSGRKYIFGTSHNNANSRIANTDTDDGGAHEFSATIAGNMDLKTNAHMVAVFDPMSGTEVVYINGIRSTVQTNDYTPLSSINNQLSYIGRSTFATDPYLNADIDEFRIYKGVMTREQQAINDATGPAGTATSLGAIVSVSLSEPFPTVPVPVAQQTVFTGTFANVTNVNLWAYGGATAVSGNTNVFTVNTNTGTVTAVGAGTTTLITGFGGQFATNTITVFVSTPTLIHRYTFNTNANDVVGTAHGTLQGGASIAVAANSSVVLSSNTADYVALPANLFAGLFSTTIEAWASFGTNASGSWLYGFGDQNGGFQGVRYLYLAPVLGNAVRTGLTAADPGNGGEQNVTTTGVGNLNGKTNVHIAVVYSPFENFQRIYINGTLRGTNVLSVQLSQTTDNLSYLGKSLYDVATGAYPANPYLNASIDEFRIYSGNLTSNQIAVDAASGPTVIVGAVGAAGAFTFNVNSNMQYHQSQTITAFQNFANVSNVNAFDYGVIAAPSFTSTTDTNIVSVTNAVGTLVSGMTGMANVVLAYNGTNYTSTITVRGGNLKLTHRYSFSEPNGSTNIIDSVGTANGSFYNTNNASVGVTNGTIDMAGGGPNGGQGYIDLPNGMISSMTNITIEVWALKRGNGVWGRLFDFGSSTTAEGQTPGNGVTYIFMSSYNGANQLRFAASLNGSAPEVPILTGPQPLTNVMNYQAVSYSPTDNATAMYFNGTNVAAGVATIALSSLNDYNNWIGRSSYGGDPDYNGIFDEFRIWEGAFNDAEALQSYNSGPNTVNVGPTFTAAASGTNFVYKWPLTAARYSLQARTNLTLGSWVNITNNPATTFGTNGFRTVTLGKSNAPAFFRLAE